MSDGKLTPDDEARALCEEAKQWLRPPHLDSFYGQNLLAQVTAHVERLIADRDKVIALNDKYLDSLRAAKVLADGLRATVATLESEIDYYRRLLGESHARETALENKKCP
jgi:hypothetical protein